MRALIVGLLLALSAGAAAQDLDYSGFLPIGGNASSNTATATGGTESRTLADIAADTIQVNSFTGCDPTGVADSTTCLQTALNSFAANKGKTIGICGIYKTTAELTISVVGTTLAGCGGGGFSSNNTIPGGAAGVGAARIIGSHTSGAVLRVQVENVTLHDFVVDADSTRYSSGFAATKVGIRVEGADTASGNTRRTFIERVRVINQPGHGVLVVNNTPASRVDFLEADHNGGDGLSIQGGSYTGRTNRTKPGQIDVFNLKSTRNGGHGFAIGGRSEVDDDDIPYRIHLINSETFYNSGDAAVRLNAFDGFVSAQNFTMQQSAVQGESSASSGQVLGTLYMRGQNLVLLNNRFISPSLDSGSGLYPIYVDNEAHAGASGTKGVYILGAYINSAAVGNYDPAVFVHSTVRDIYATATLNSDTTNMFTYSGLTRYEVTHNGAKRSDHTVFGPQGLSAFLTAQTDSASVTPAWQFGGTSSALMTQALAGFSNTQSVAPRYECFKSRGATVGTFTIVSNNDFLCSLVGEGADGNSFSRAALITFRVDGTPADGIVPGRMEFSTYNSAGTEVLGAILDSSQVFTHINSGVTGDQLNLRSQRVGIVSGNVVGGISAQSNDSSLTAPGTITGRAEFLANETHTASALGTNWVLSLTPATTTTPIAAITVIPAAAGAVVGDGTKTYALNSSDWDIDAAGVVTGINSIALTDGLAISATDPTVSSGFGTSPSIAGNGTIAFTVDVGTGGAATGGVLTMPAAATGWNCSVANRTGQAANRADQRTVQTATTTTTVTVQNQTVSTGAALAWTASDILALSCFGY